MQKSKDNSVALASSSVSRPDVLQVSAASFESASIRQCGDPKGQCRFVAMDGCGFSRMIARVLCNQNCLVGFHDAVFQIVGRIGSHEGAFCHMENGGMLLFVDWSSNLALGEQ
jgi:hypothetical protein